ncbi:sodium/potassium-transporting ATPase subunit beta-2-like isoform X2 [Adelges cooleyi]|uniref:sodium/potassium-transporting ATPase subunit beta-2-like isoform X2 n=1 Tax=Adelges cooleyi TaxID=133065 RepID=UPI00217F535F|nr:sodium/potassium-transporting ATPase subunit beta-2-like isoform X2 [Adelges cooleyi]
MVKHTTDTNGIGYEWEYAKVKDDRTVWQKIINGIYNPNSHEFLGRSARSWGLGFRPMSLNVEDGSLIYFEANNATNVETWTKSLDKFLSVYKNKTLLPNKGANQQSGCSYTNPPQNGKVCDVTLANMGPCTTEQKYQFHKGQPCVFIKLNKIFDWEPEFYSNFSDLPADMPKELKDIIKTKLRNEMSPVLNTVWVTCSGETPNDKENIGPIKMYPQEGFPGYYYPYRNKQDYLSPLIAVHFINPKKHTLINVECRAWAKNIIFKRSLQNREGSVHFELMID